MMTEAQRRRRLRTIVRRAKYLERAPELDYDDVEALSSTAQQALEGAGGQWLGRQDGRYGRPFWRGRW